MSPALLVLIFLLAVDAYSGQVPMPPGMTLFGARGRGDAQFLNPQGLAFHPDGTLLIADSGNRSLKEYTLDGAFLMAYDSRPPDADRGAAAAPADDMEANQLLARQRLLNDSNGPFGNVRLVKPTDIAVGGDGAIYIVDQGARRVQKFDRELRPLLEIGGPVNQSGLIAAPGATGAPAGRFGMPASVAVDAEHNVYVTDAELNCVQKFNYFGAFLVEWGAAGAADGQFNQPWGIVVDGAGNVWVADWGNNRVQKFTPDGRHLLTVSGDLGGQAISKPSDVAAGPQNTIWILGWESGGIHVISESGQSIRATEPLLTAAVARGGAEGRLVALAVAPDNRIFLTDSIRNVVVGVDPSQANNPRNALAQRARMNMDMMMDE